MLQELLTVYHNHAFTVHAHDEHAPASAEALLAHQMLLSISLYQYILAEVVLGYGVLAHCYAVARHAFAVCMLSVTT